MIKDNAKVKKANKRSCSFPPEGGGTKGGEEKMKDKR